MLCIFTERLHSLSSRNNSAVQFVLFNKSFTRSHANKWNTFSETSKTKQGLSFQFWGGRVVRRRWVSFRCRCVLLIWMIVGQGPTVLAVGAGGVGLDIFSLLFISLLSLSLWETARYRLKYCLKGPLNPKQPTNQLSNSTKNEQPNILRSQ